MLIKRLEHIYVDSIWAHKASGLRGALIRTTENLESGKVINTRTLERLHRMSFHVLEEAAREILRHSG